MKYLCVSAYGYISVYLFVEYQISTLAILYRLLSSQSCRSEENIFFDIE